MPYPALPFVSADRLGLTLPDGRRLFGGLTLSFARERTGLVGANGVGKSLLLDVLVGVRPPSIGTVRRRGRLAAWSLPERVRARMARAGLGHLPLDRPVSQVSGGEATRIALIGALLGEPDLLILDEPTNDLDARSRRMLLETLEQWSSGGLLVVSHDREVLRRVDRILELTPTGLREYGGG